MAIDSSPHARILAVVGAAFTAVICSFGLWDPLEIDDRKHLRRSTLQSARGIRADVIADLEIQLNALAGIHSALDSRDQPSRAEWEREARLFLNRYPSHRSVHWVEPTHAVRWTVHGKPILAVNATASVLHADVLRALYAASQNEDAEPTLSRTFYLAGRATAAAVIPIAADPPQQAAWLVGVFDVATIMDAMLRDHADLGYAVAVFDGSREIYRRPLSESTHEDAWAEELPVILGGATWRLRVWPEPATVAASRSALPEVALMLGALLGFALMITVHAARTATSASAELRQARDELETRVEERTAELQRVNDSLTAEIVDRGRAEESLRDLSGRLLHVQDEERRRLARELHDSTAQSLVATALGVAKARSHPTSDGNPELAAALRGAAESIETATAEIRTLSYLLHPPMLDELGLEYATPWYAEGFSARSGIAVHVEIQPDFGRLSHDIELALFRIVQEALTNVHRHSGSRSARLSLRRNTDAVLLTIQDYGRGIAAGVLEPIENVPPRIGVGIAGMHERVRQLGGRMEIAGSESGTVIRAILPLHDTEQGSFVV